MASLSNAELGELCDWSTNLLGGYSATISCSNFTITPSTREGCIASISYNSSCVLSVRQFENCTLAEVPSKGCDTPGPDCAVELQCFTRDAGK